MQKKSLKILFVFILVAGGIFIGIRNRLSLNKNHLNSVGFIYDLETSSKGGGVFIKFVFRINDKNYYGSSPISIKGNNEFSFLYKLLKGKSLPIIYEKGNPENCEMLFRMKEYEKYKVNLSADQQKIVNSTDSLISH